MHVKICGITCVEDALLCVAAGASAIGLNFVPSSPRAIDLVTARAIVDAVASGRSTGADVLVVGVVADKTISELHELLAEVKLGCLQLHGDEPPEALMPFLPHAYKALRIASPDDVVRADAYPGDYLLVDAYVRGVLGGTGARLPPSWVEPLARRRKLTLAGGLAPDNVAAAIDAVRPHAVDVASGVERRGDPRRKDEGAVRAFVAEARRA